jgi:ArsR family transcriptional regulator
VPKQLPALDTTAAVCCPPIASTALDAEAALAIALRLKALADPARVQLLNLLLLGPEPGCRTTDLAQVVGLSEPTVSHHLRQLREAGLIAGEKVATNTYYRPLRENLKALCAVIDPCC